MAYKHDYDKTLTRLRIILQRLNDGESLSTKELASEFNVSTRTIQRDFNEKLISSYPIYQESKKWQMKDGFKIEKIRDIDDKIVLDIVEKMTDNIGGDFASKSKKLLHKIKNNDYNPIYTKLNIEDISDKFVSIQVIEKAIKSKQKLKIDYENNGSKTSATIKPLKIVNFEGFWYLIALDNGLHNTLKKYYLKNIFSPKLQNSTFTTEANIENLLDNSISIWFQKDIEPFEVRLLIDKKISKFFKRRPLPTQSILNEKDNSLEISITITHEMEIIPIIKYWLPNIKVIEPIWIQDIINEDLIDYLNL